ncbi:MAG: PAS domain-containing protein [Chloroflexi bacterium]|nr:PAS domain-containing protein [Chloroflexota bacterium]
MESKVTEQKVQDELDSLRARLDEAEQTLEAIRSGEVDALVVTNAGGYQVFTLHGADWPYRVLVESMQEGAVTIGESGQILYCNPRFASMLNAPLQKVLGASIYPFLASEHRQKFESLLNESRTTSHHAEFCLVAGDGTTVPVSVAFSPLPLENLQAVCLVVTDLTVQTQREQEIIQLQKELENRVRERTAELMQTNEQLHLEIAERIRVGDRLARLQAVTTALSAALNVQEVSRAIVLQGSEAADAVSVGVLLLSEDHKLLRLTYSKGYPEGLVQSWINVPTGELPPTFQTCIQTLETAWGVAPALLFDTQQVGWPPDEEETWAVIPLGFNLRSIGLLCLGFAAAEELDSEKQRFILTLADQCAQALHRALLHERVQMTATIEERQRLARDLHDAVSQTLFSASVLAETLPRIAQRDPERAIQQLPEVSRLTRGALAEMRSLLLELRPAALVNSRMSQLIQQLCNAIQVKKRIAVDVTVEDDAPLPMDVHISLYRIIQEALNNIVKHSRASRVRINLRSDGQQVVLDIEDNGAGFDLHNPKAGLGLGMMRERAESIGADLQVYSQRGQGTTIRVVWVSAARKIS